MTRFPDGQPHPADPILQPDDSRFAFPCSQRVPFSGQTSGISCKIFPTPYRTDRIVEQAAGDLQVTSGRFPGRIPAVGPLRPILEAALAATKAPMHLRLTQVLNAWFERNPDGKSFGLRVVYQGLPADKAPLDKFLASHPRPTYAPDFGASITAEGLHLSELTIRDAVGSEEFLTGKAPSYGLIPTEEVLDPGFPLRLYGMLMALRVTPRSFTLDVSCLPNLSDELKAAISRLNRWFRRRCTGSALAYRKIQSLGDENRQSRDRLAQTGLFDGRRLVTLMSQPQVECPHCGVQTSLKADPRTGAPSRSQQRCELCARPLLTGRLLADRARTRGVHGWQENISGPRVMVASHVLPRETKSDATSAGGATEDRKVTTGMSTLKDTPKRSPNKADRSEGTQTLSATRPIRGKQVVRTASKSGRPSPGYRAPLQGHVSAVDPAMHTTRGSIRCRAKRVTPLDTVRLAEQQRRYIEQLGIGHTFVEM